MKKVLIIFVFIKCNFIFSQDRLEFVKDMNLKFEIEKSINFLDQTKVIPSQIKEKVIFITFDFFDLDSTLEIENLGINFSTFTPLQLGELRDKGQFITRYGKNSRIRFYNYNANVVLIFIMGERFFDENKMTKMSEEVKVEKINLSTDEYFNYIKGGELPSDGGNILNRVKNFISFNIKNGKITPRKVNTFDLKTFIRVWYGVEADEIPVTGGSVPDGGNLKSF